MRKAAIAVIILAVCIFSCKSGLDEKVKSKFNRQEEDVLKRIQELINSFDSDLIQKMPKNPVKTPKEMHPLVKWRVNSFNGAVNRQLFDIVEETKGRSWHENVLEVRRFFEMQEKFWKRFIKAKEYEDELKKSKKSKYPVIAEQAAFDWAFMNAEPFYDSFDISLEEKATYFFRFWQPVFDFRRMASESVGQYLERLCKAKLSGFCRTVPFEYLPFALEKPYIETIRSFIKDFRQNFPQSRLNPAMDVFDRDLAERLKNVGQFIEDPLLPSSVSKRPFVGDVFFVFKKDGMYFEDEKFLSWKEDYKIDKKEYKDFQDQFSALLPKLIQERGAENLSTIAIEPDSSVPVRLFLDVLPVMSDVESKWISFAGRRRIDNVNKRVMSVSLTLHFYKNIAKNITDKNISKLPLNCLTVANTIPVEQNISFEPKKILIISDNGLFLGDYAEGNITTEKIDKIDQSLTEQKIPLFVMVPDETKYETVISTLDPFFNKCRGEGCEFFEDRTPNIEMAFCKIGGK